MATLNTLRTKGGVLVTIVIGISLIAFLLGDFAGRQSVFGSKIKVGEINGESVPYADYAKEVEYLTNVNKIMSGTESVDDQTQLSIESLAWETIFNRISIYPGYEKLGLSVSSQEIFDLVYGENISPVLAQSGIFSDPQTGMYDRSRLKNFVTSISSDQTGRMRVMWDYIQNNVENDALQGKFNALVSGMVYVTDLEASLSQQKASGQYVIRYVDQPYSSVSDSSVTVTAAEIKKFYEERKNAFRQIAARDIEYVMFEVYPSATDYAETKVEVEKLAQEFAATENPMQYVTLNSHTPADVRYWSREQLPVEVADFVFGPEGKSAVYGPTLQENVYSMIRVADLKSFPDSISVRQIILPALSPSADSLEQALNAGGDFKALAAAYSLEPTGVDLGKISTEALPADIMSKIISTPKGKIARIDNAQGTLLLDVYATGTMTPKAQLAVVIHNVVPSQETESLAYAKASSFASAVGGSAEIFNKVVTDSVYSKRVARIMSTDRNVSGINNSRELVRWAFGNDLKAVSGIMELDGHYVIATLSSMREDGFATLAQATPEITMMLKREKKGDLIASKMKGAASIDELAGKLGVQVQVADATYNNAYIASVGNEPAVSGAVSGAKLGVVSRPVKGSNGVYVVLVDSNDLSEAVTVESERVRIEAYDANYITARASQALHEMSAVKDTRVRYF